MAEFRRAWSLPPSFASGRGELANGWHFFIALMQVHRKAAEPLMS